MTLTPICSLESARKKFLMTSTYMLSRKWESNVFALGWRNDSNTHLFARIGEKKILMNSTYIMSRMWESNVFGYGGLGGKK